MFKIEDQDYKNDLFIIGAGCSVPYGFPTGDQLLQEIKSLNFIFSLTEKQLNFLYKQEYGQLYPTEEKEQELKNFVENDIQPNLESLKYTSILSIDQYLKNSLGSALIQSVMKIAISNIISRKEKESVSNVGTKEFTNNIGTIDWIQHLITKIDSKFKHDNNEQLIKYLKNISFISFNYDRVLEYFLLNYLVYDRDLFEEAYDIINEMNIFHINGSIGSIETAPYGETNQDIGSLVNGMRTVWEAISEKHEANVTMAKECVKKADRIFVLGTSYIEENMNSVGFDVNYKQQNGRFFGTAFRLSTASINRIANKWIQNGLIEQSRPIEGRPIRDITALDMIIDEFDI